MRRSSVYFLVDFGTSTPFLMHSPMLLNSVNFLICW